MTIKRKQMNSEDIGLAWSFCVSPSSCDNPIYYKEFIALYALSDMKAGQALTHLFIDTEANKLAGYISMRATSLISESETGTLIVHLSVEIAELAVSENYERKGIGTEMFNFAVLCANQLRKEYIGIKYITVCSDPKSVEFYKKLGFAMVNDLYDVPRDGWNDNCVPMYIQLPEL